MSRPVAATLLAGLLVSLPASLPAGQPPAPDRAKPRPPQEGVAEAEAAVARGLAWLAKQQKSPYEGLVVKTKEVDVKSGSNDIPIELAKP